MTTEMLVDSSEDGFHPLEWSDLQVGAFRRSETCVCRAHTTKVEKTISRDFGALHHHFSPLRMVRKNNTQVLLYVCLLMLPNDRHRDCRLLVFDDDKLMLTGGGKLFSADGLPNCHC